jgi:hypothetical protein
MKWFREHLKDGTECDFHPDMSLPDSQANIASYMVWVGDSLAGWGAVLPNSRNGATLIPCASCSY